jgi:hypothetical protein
VGATPSPLDGVWQGILNASIVPARGGEWDWKPGSEFRLEISGSSAKVVGRHEGDVVWMSNRPLNVVRLDTNAVITSIATGGNWVETWSFIVTLVDSTHLQVSWHRQVNNKKTPRSDPHAVFDIFGYGELEARAASANKG